ncbi:MAG: HAMP domain-containing histidine kinase [Ktedonobacterales bacterium]|nr:HAMP domain-containing histidine kinase [Ktedonobacterales bacterium]
MEQLISASAEDNVPPGEASTTTGGIIITTAYPPFVLQQMTSEAGRRLGRLREGTVGHALAEVIPDTQQWREAIVQAAATREEVKRTLTLRSPDGTIRQLLLTCLPILDATPTPELVLSLLHEPPAAPSVAITDLSGAEAVAQLLPFPAWLYDPQGGLRAVNEATLHLFQVADFAQFVAVVGATLGELMTRLQPRLASPHAIARATEDSIYTFTPDRMTMNGEERRWGSVMRREGAEPLRQDEMPIARVLRRRTAPSQLISLQHPLLEAEVLVRSYAVPIIDATGQGIGALWLTLDVTDDLLQEGRRDAILALAGHDIRNPLTPARGLLQQLKLRLGKEGDRYSREMGYIDTVLNQLDRIRQISSDLDAVGLTNYREVTASMATCELVALCRTVAAQQMERHPAITVTLKTNAESIKGVWARLHLERALTMLLDSAARRSPPGRAVTLRLRQLRTQVKVEISDQGAALAPLRLDALRAVLDRGGAALALTEGWDLDLSTTQTLLALNRSRLYVASRPRAGTTFWFALPLPLPESPE